MSKFNLLHLNVSIFQQLQIEEALLRTDTNNWCILNYGSTPAIVMGISGKVEELVEREATVARNIPLIKRFSGGGTVVVDEKTIFVTWIVNSEHIEVPCCPKKILEWTGQIYEPIFEGINFRVMENDYAIGLRKCGGNAQYLRKNRWLHHTSFLWDYSPENMQLLKTPPKMPVYRQAREHHDFLCTLKEYFDSDHTFIKKLTSEFKNRFQLLPIHPMDLTPYLEKPHRRSLCLIDPY